MIQTRGLFVRTQVPYVLGFLVRSALLRPSVSPDVRQMHGRSLFRSFGGQRCGPRACVFHHVRVVLKQSTIEAGTSSTPSLPLTRPPRCASHSPDTRPTRTVHEARHAPLPALRQSRSIEKTREEDRDVPGFGRDCRDRETNVQGGKTRGTTILCV